MPRIVVELTNRCNLRCLHCFDERHAATGDLSMGVIDRLLEEGRGCGIDHFCFTGGEPTLHRRFHEIVSHVSDAGYGFSFVSNGVNFRTVATLLLRHRAAFGGVTFSLDGAREATHDRLRGKGSFRQVMRAATLCVFHGLPFTFNMVLTADNQGEVEAMVRLAARLGSRGVRFGHLMFTADTTARGLNLSPAERRRVEARIWELRRSAPVFVGMAPGYFSESPFFPCAPLELDEFNVDHRGNLTLCCQLSGYAGQNEARDIMGNLHDVSLAEACDRFRARVARYLADKRERVQRGAFDELDHFPCWYCAKYLGKVTSLPGFPERAWASAAPDVEEKRSLHVHISSCGAAGPGRR
jgi:MoaA/NifB/PqqE/SkfB family radical SAM enzyme